MAPSLLWITSVLMAIFTILHHNCESVYGFNKNRETHPQKMVEIIELMLSQRPNNSEKKEFGIQKVPQGDSYEILTTPIKNHELKGSQQIKILVESNFNSDDKVKRIVGPEKEDKQSIFDVLPLSIETVGLNIEHYQQHGIQNVKLNNHDSDEVLSKDTESYPSKRQTTWGGSFQISKSTNTGLETFIPIRQQEPKDIVIQREPSYVDQNNPHQPVRVPVYDGDYSSSVQNGKRIVQQPSDYVIVDTDPERSRTNEKRIYESNPIYETPGYDVRPSNERRAPREPEVRPIIREPEVRPIVRETEVRPIIREPEVRPIVRETEVRPSNDRRPSQRESDKRPTKPSREPEVRPSNDRRPSVREPEPRPIIRETEVRPSNDRRPSARETNSRPSNDRRPSIRDETPEERPSIERRPVYASEDEEDLWPAGSSNTRPNRGSDDRRTTYEEDERRPIYTKEPERPSKETYPDYEETWSSSNKKTYAEEEEESRPSRNSRPSYSKKKSSSSSSREYDERPTDSSYGGFPESYQIDNNNHYSRPLQVDSARSFPASPCSKVFKYEGREPERDRWYADLYVTTDEVLTGMRLDITLDSPADLMTNWFAQSRTRDNIHYTILSLHHKLIPGPPETVKIMVKFNPNKQVPFVRSIALNGRTICPVNRVQKTTTRRPVQDTPGDSPIRRTTPRYQESQKKPVEYETATKRPTERPYEEVIRTTLRPERSTEYRRPNPNGYEETDLNSFGPSTKKPHGRPAHSNGKPPSHAAKPANPSRPGNSHGSSQGNSKPSSSSGSGQQSSGHNGGEAPKNSNICGTPATRPNPLITHGQATTRGQWPWQAALFKTLGQNLSFFCGGSLISKNYVLTAAHCVAKSHTTKPVDESVLVVYLGKYRLFAWSEIGILSRGVIKIHIHPKYTADFKSDIAVLALNSPVEYTDYIRPICLWDRTNTRIENVEGKEGTVVGWGYDENLNLTQELRIAKMPIVKQQTCLWSYPDFYPQFTSNMTYCAGYRNGTSACNGDSGGGMIFPFKGQDGVERWHLRGIVSISPARADARVCDSNYYVVFTDVAKFLPWLDNFV